jgi:hypothetical protein
MASIKIGDFIISTGMQVRARDSAQEVGIAPAGVTASVYKIMQGGNNPFIGLYTGGKPVYDYDWHDFEGEVEECSGHWVELNNLLKYFDIQSQNARITKDIYIRNRNLKGMVGKIVAIGELAFVELNEDVGGCSADGLGKAGHCVAVPVHAIESTSKYEDLSKLEFEAFEL